MIRTIFDCFRNIFS